MKRTLLGRALPEFGIHCCQYNECEAPTFSIGLEVEGAGVSHVPVVSACEKTTLKSPSCVGAAGLGEFPRNPGLVTSSSTILPISSTNDCLLHPVQ
jgi:hypothetical protein